MYQIVFKIVIAVVCPFFLWHLLGSALILLQVQILETPEQGMCSNQTDGGDYMLVLTAALYGQPTFSLLLQVKKI